MKIKQLLTTILKKSFVIILFAGIFIAIGFLVNSAPSDSIITVNNTDPRLSQFNFDMLICADNNTINFVPNENVTVKINDTATLKVVGIYKESIGTSQLLPKCVYIEDGQVVGNMTCITEHCKRIIMFNVLNGEVKTVWVKGQIW